MGKQKFGIEEYLNDYDQSNIDEYFELSKKIIDKQFGKGFSDSHPELVVHMCNSLINLFLLNLISSDILHIPERIVEVLCERMSINIKLNNLNNG